MAEFKARIDAQSKNQNTQHYEELKKIVQKFEDAGLKINNISYAFVIDHEENEIEREMIAPLDKVLKTLSRKEVKVLPDSAEDFNIYFTSAEPINVPQKVELSLKVGLSVDEDVLISFIHDNAAEEDGPLIVSPTLKHYRPESSDQLTKKAVNILLELGYKEH